MHRVDLRISQLSGRCQHHSEKSADLVITQINGTPITDPTVDLCTYGRVVLDIGREQATDRQIADIEQMGGALSDDAANAGAGVNPIRDEIIIRRSLGSIGLQPETVSAQNRHITSFERR